MITTVMTLVILIILQLMNFLTKSVIKLMKLIHVKQRFNNLISINIIYDLFFFNKKNYIKAIQTIIQQLMISFKKLMYTQEMIFVNSLILMNNKLYIYARIIKMGSQDEDYK